LPPVTSFDTKVYHGGSQNWAISQDKLGFIYVANNDGLLEYNGSEWTLYPSPNESIFRSVKAYRDRVYTGCYMDFGYWERSDIGDLIYSSLGDSIRDKMLPDEQIWKIILHEDYLIFQSFDQLYLYDLSSETIEIIRPESKIEKTPVTTEEACQSLLESMDDTEDNLISLLQDILLPQEVIKNRVERANKDN